MRATFLLGRIEAGGGFLALWTKKKSTAEQRKWNNGTCKQLEYWNDGMME
jgi:hypothetical protein